MAPWSGTRLGKSLSCEAQQVYDESQLRQVHGSGQTVEESQPVDEGASSPEAV
jgi:hypothetical protein